MLLSATILLYKQAVLARKKTRSSASLTISGNEYITDYVSDTTMQTYGENVSLATRGERFVLSKNTPAPTGSNELATAISATATSLTIFGSILNILQSKQH